MNGFRFLQKIALVASLSLVMVLTFSCSSGSSINGNEDSSSSSDVVSPPLSSSMPSSSSVVAVSSSSVRSSSSRVSTGTDYSDMNNWSIFTAPDKLTKEVDIFIVSPTVPNIGSSAEDCPYASLTNSAMRNGIDNWYRSLGKIATEYTNPYMPYYRMVNAFSGCSGSGGSMTNGPTMDDIRESFEYYLTHINKGERPFILFGFSQGAQVLWELAVKYLGEHQKNHIITYAVGIPYRSSLAASAPVKFSQSYNDINTIVAWNSYYESDSLCTSSQLSARAMSGPITNPITWTTDENYHAMTENSNLNTSRILGAQAYNKLGILLVRRLTASATTACGASSGSTTMGEHGNDVPFFSASIAKNIGDRIAAWKAK